MQLTELFWSYSFTPAMTGLKAGEWMYRAEGGRNLVVSYCGTDGEFMGKVLRLAKRKVGADKLEQGSGEQAAILRKRGIEGQREIEEERGELEHCARLNVREGRQVTIRGAVGKNHFAITKVVKSEVRGGAEMHPSNSKKGKEEGGIGQEKHTSCAAAFRFARETIAPLLASRREILLLGQLIAVTSPFLSALQESCLSLRPAYRLSLEIDVSAAHGWLLPDLCHIRGVSSGVVAIEIKPKSCVLPGEKEVCAGHEAKASVSRFRMMQKWKLAGVSLALLSLCIA